MPVTFGLFLPTRRGDPGVLRARDLDRGSIHPNSAPAVPSRDPLSPAHFLVETDGPVMTVTFNRPERRNGLNGSVLRELEAIIHHVRDSGEIRSLVLTGAGTVFCAGAEPTSVTERAETGDMAGNARGGPRMIGRIFDQLAHLETMTVVAVNGHAVGGGWSLALAADYCLAVPDAQFWVPEVDLGVPFRGLSSFALTHRMGPWLAKEAVILCRRFSASELCGLGVINRVVEPDRLMDAAREIAARFAAQPAKAAINTKRDVNAVIYGPRHY
jgi:enoyl-CoA hydratase